jgi:NTP pyrophosphatase (non-canonical NTP hydrolase)
VSRRNIRDWQRECHRIATSKGWWDDVPMGARLSGDPNVLGAKLALIHSEVSEALEDVRIGSMESGEDEKGKPCGFPSELADVVIRCFDLAGGLGIDLEMEIDAKCRFNETRSMKHGGKVL